MEKAFPQLFQAVQMARVFPDSKTFTDCIPKKNPAAINALFQDKSSVKEMDKEALESFVQDNFDLPPSLSSNFKADLSKSPAEHINSLWPVLTRKPDKAGEGTKIPLPNSYIAPGGRFREIYYWDSYFTMLGLQVSDSSQYLIRNMVENFAFLIDEMGFIPNGNRTYFAGRSQPPFFSLMVKLLMEVEEPKVLQEFLPALEKEYNFWMKGKELLSEENPAIKRVVRIGDDVIMNRYWDDLPGPRAESYAEDVHLADTTGRDKEQLYTDLRAACESGWDFSTRWFRDGQNLGTIHTTEIVPVDLNALLYHLETLLAEAYEANGNDEKRTEMERMSANRKAAILTYNWDSKSQAFQDYDFVEGKVTGRISLAMMYPLFLNIASPSQAEKVAERLGKDFLKSGGLLTTPNISGQQWDGPNGWAPLQWVSIKGLRNYEMDVLADTIKNRWVNLNTKVYKATGKMVEKYNVLDMGLEAGGGEYPLQDGFGWSNGVLLKLLSE
ncbi:MAG: alpha,alpha-trehalase TreF [Bacteroidia bacterium]|nr:alpha,alpha-trehalase TreF [Bacteroidia bacterium]